MGVRWRCEVPNGEEEETQRRLETAETVTHLSLPPELGVLHLLSSFKMLGQCPVPLDQTWLRPKRTEGQKGGRGDWEAGTKLSRKHRTPAPTHSLVSDSRG